MCATQEHMPSPSGFWVSRWGLWWLWLRFNHQTLNHQKVNKGHVTMLFVHDHMVIPPKTSFGVNLELRQTINNYSCSKYKHVK